MIGRLTCLLLGLAHCFCAVGQPDSTLSVTSSVVTVVEARVTTDLLGDQNVAALLPTAGVYVKNYGPGSVATLSLRGGSAGQTAVLWNGLPLGNPSLGLLDLSTLPTAGLDYLRIERGGASADYGSGAVTGVLQLVDTHQEGVQTGFRTLTEAGSFGHFHQQVAANFASDSSAWSGFVLADFTEAENDFPFVPEPGLDARRLSHAYFRNRNLRQGFTFQPNGGHRLQFRYWYGDTERQVPPTTVQRRSAAVQEDRHHRFFLEHDAHFGKKWHLETKVGHFREQLNYQDPLSGVDSPSRFTKALAESRLRWHFDDRRSGLLLGGTLNHTEATVDEAYAEGRTDTRRALLSGYYQHFGNWEINSKVRQEWIGEDRAPLAPNLRLNYRPNDALSFTLLASRDYRYPTLNDRFWPIGGNAELRPEVGWSQEFRLRYDRDLNGGYLRIEGRAYRRVTDQFIQWAPPETGFFWSVRNLEEVRAAGWETYLSLSFWNGLDLSINYAHVRSEFRGDQLFYTPRHQGAARLRYVRRHWDIYLNQRYGGATRGVNDDPEAYWLTDIGASYQRKFGPVPVRLFAHLNNLFNADYRIIERRPLPGRHIRLGISLGFTSSKH